MADQKTTIEPEAHYRCPVCSSWFLDKDECQAHINQHQEETDCVKIQLFFHMAGEANHIWSFSVSPVFKHSLTPEDGRVLPLNYNGVYFWEILNWDARYIESGKMKLMKTAMKHLKKADLELTKKMMTEQVKEL